MKAPLTEPQVVQVAEQAGFSGQALAVIVAIAKAESNWIPDNRNTHNADGSVDRGILQINSRAWANIPDSVCDDPAQAFQVAYVQISKKGTDFTPWVTFQNGAYKQYLDPGITTGNQYTIGPWTQAKAQGLWPWLFPFTNTPQGKISNRWDGKSEFGVDLAEVVDTPITALTYGTVLNTFYYGGGGVVVVESQVRSFGRVAVYYQHLDLITVQKGDTVKVGDQVGLSGGQLSGGHHPATSQYSSGPHIEVGFNCGSGYSGYMSLGNNADPIPWITDLVAKGPPLNDIIGSGGVTGPAGNIINAFNNASSGTGPIADDFASICAALDESMQFGVKQTSLSINVDILNPVGSLIGDTASSVGSDIWNNLIGNIEPFVLRGMFILMGFILIWLAFFQMIRPAAERIGPLVVQAAAAAA